MKTIYVKQQGAYLRKKRRRLLITKGEEKIFEKPIINLEEVVLFGNIQVSNQALRFLLDNGIEITFLSRFGKYMGHARSNSSKNIFLRLAQYKKYNDQEFSANLSRKFVFGKIHNQIQVLKYYLTQKEYKECVVFLEKQKEKLKTKETIKEIRGIEGITSKKYYSLFGKMIKSDFSFSKRTRRPPTDPVNALLSLAYTFITNTISSLLETKSFELYLGFLHRVKYGRKSLPLDMVEEFRQGIIDRFILRLINKRMIGQMDFEHNEQEYSLKDKAFNKFCVEYHEYLGKKRKKYNRSFFDILSQQINLLQKTIMGQNKYDPFMVIL